jgi:hypothetical protein
VAFVVASNARECSNRHRARVERTRCRFTDTSGTTQIVTVALGSGTPQ